jgi:cyclophilin family peptidyl-prolyl cis-trans isomerase
VSPSNARRRQLQKLAQRRAEERKRARRRKALTITVALLVAAGGGTAAFLAFTGTDTRTPQAAPTGNASPTANPPAQPAPKKVACGAKAPQGAGEEKTLYATAPPFELDTSKRHTAVIKTSCGTIEIELLAVDSPITVNSFVFLAQQGFYDGTYFHRVIKGFMDQGGDPTGTGGGGPGYQFADETTNGLVFDKVGLLAMANSGADSNGSQFFITVSKPSHLNGKHTIFGRVTKGYDVAQRINSQKTGEGDRPTFAIFIESIRIVVA